MPDRVHLLLPANRESCMGFRLAYLSLTLNQSKDHDQIHRSFHFFSIILEIVADIYITITAID